MFIFIFDTQFIHDNSATLALSVLISHRIFSLFFFFSGPKTVFFWAPVFKWVRWELFSLHSLNIHKCSNIQPFTTLFSIFLVLTQNDFMDL